MIRFALKCGQDHEFESWFKDNAAYDRQVAAGHVACPLCGDTSVAKAPMAPRIAKGRSDGGRDETLRALTGEMLGRAKALQEYVEANCEHVGDRFAEEARRIHYGETESREIYGNATDGEAKSLREEGVAFAQIPWLPRTDS